MLKKIEVTIRVRGLPPDLAKCWVNSLSPDNVGIPEECQISLGAKEDVFILVLSGSCRLSSFIRTLNDVLASIRLLRGLSGALEGSCTNVS